MNFSADPPLALQVIAETIEGAPRPMVLLSPDHEVLVANRMARMIPDFALGGTLPEAQGIGANRVSTALTQAERTSHTVPVRLRVEGEERLFLAWRVAPLPGIETPLIMLAADPANTIAVRINSLTNARNRTKQALEHSRMERDRLRSLANRLKRIARSDPLTGLLNAKGFRATCDAFLRQEPGPGVLIFADLNAFKPVNDTHGHAAGDALLQAIGQRLQKTLPEGAICGRLGGDEFAIYLPNRTEPTVDFDLAGLRKCFTRPLMWRADRSDTAQQLQVGVALGFALAPGDGTSTEALLRAADARMYADKPEEPRQRRRMPFRASTG